MSKLYERIELLAASSGMSVAQVAHRAGISPSIFYDIKSGRKSDFSRKTAEKVAGALGITVDDLYKTESTPADASAEVPDSDLLREIIDRSRGLTEEQQRALLDLMRSMSSDT